MLNSTCYFVNFSIILIPYEGEFYYYNTKSKTNSQNQIRGIVKCFYRSRILALLCGSVINFLSREGQETFLHQG